MQLPKISIVTPSFNQGAYIEQTILSVLNQGYPDLEYIIIDGGSTDGTIDIIKKYASQLTYWVSEKDKGQTDAINKGFQKCTGEIFNWLNSDDYYEPGTLLEVGRLFGTDGSVDVVCGKEWGFNNENPSDRVLHPGSIVETNVYKTICTGIIDQPCTFFKREKIGHFFPLNSSLRYVMDRQLWWSYLLENGQSHIKTTDTVFTNFRLHTNSKTVHEGAQFEKEYDLLKYSIFLQLNAPEILKNQLAIAKSDIFIQWRIAHLQPEYLLAEFASVYAGLQYVKADLKQVQSLMKLVKKWRGNDLNKEERKWWIISNRIPHFLTHLSKKIRGR